MKKLFPAALVLIGLLITLHLFMFNGIIGSINGLEEKVENRESHLGDEVVIMGDTLEVLKYNTLSDSYMLSDGREVGAKYIIRQE